MNAHKIRHISHKHDGWALEFVDLYIENGVVRIGVTSAEVAFAWKILLYGDGTGQMQVSKCTKSGVMEWFVPGPELILSFGDKNGFLHLFWGLFDKDFKPLFLDEVVDEDDIDIDDNIADFLRGILGKDQDEE